MITQRKATRKNGKRKNPAYQQLTAYVSRETWQQMKVALLREDREISELIQQLVDDWLDSKHPSPDARRRSAAVQQAMLEVGRVLSGPALDDPRERATLMAQLSIECLQRVVSGIEQLSFLSSGEASKDKPSSSPGPGKPKT